MRGKNLMHDLAPLGMILLAYAMDHLRLLIRLRAERLDFTLESLWASVLCNLVFGAATTGLLWKALRRREVQLAPCLVYLAVGITAALLPGPARFPISHVPLLGPMLSRALWTYLPAGFAWHGYTPIAGSIILALGIVKLLQRRTVT